MLFPKIVGIDLDNTIIGGEVGETLHKDIKADIDSPEGKFFIAIQRIFSSRVEQNWISFNNVTSSVE